jgi:hypothetical protein
MIESQLSGEAIPKQSVTKSRAWTIVATVLSLPVLLTLLFPVAFFICQFFYKVIQLSSKNQYLIVDAIVSFALLCAFFFALLSITKIYGRFIVVFCAVFMFLFWGVESEFFWKGLNPLYPAWYEVNMAINDIFAALFMIFVKKRTTTVCTGSAINTASR